MIISSIDLENGRAVQKIRGQETVLIDARDPIELAREFNRYGPVAVIDLDAAFGRGSNLDLIKKVCQVAEVRTGGGIRDAAHGRALLRAGANQLIIGTAATSTGLLAEFPRERIVIALDHKDGQVVDQGWTHSTGADVLQRGLALAPYCGGFLCTNVTVEGTMTGAPLELALELQRLTGRPVTVAGGIKDVTEAVHATKQGLHVQVGMALYTGKLELLDALINSLDFDKRGGLIPTVVQEVAGRVLMVAYSKPMSLRLALTEGLGIYWSTKHDRLWRKGAHSGHYQKLIACRADCDLDALLFTVEQTGAACHTGSFSCFGNRQFTPATLLQRLYRRIASRDPNSYTAQLAANPDQLHAKIMEEAKEVCDSPDDDNLIWEAADVLYHVMVKLATRNLSWSAVEHELAGREKD